MWVSVSGYELLGKGVQPVFPAQIRLYLWCELDGILSLALDHPSDCIFHWGVCCCRGYGVRISNLTSCVGEGVVQVAKGLGWGYDNLGRGSTGYPPTAGLHCCGYQVPLNSSRWLTLQSKPKSTS